MDSKPLVSIIMPIFGVEKYIENSVRSVVNQTYDNIELILVDDGSPDRSVEIAEKVLSEHNYPYKLIRQKNQGQGEARNAGIRIAQGDWILFLDSDDLLLPETVAELISAVNENNPDIVFSDFRLIHSVEEISNTEDQYSCLQISAKELQRKFLLRDKVVLVVGTLFKRDLLNNYGLFFEKIPWSEDQHFVWRYLSFIDKAVYIRKSYYQYLQRPGSIMSASSIEKMIVSYPAICELPDYYKDNEAVNRFLVPRWVMGTLNASARITDYRNWKLLFVRMNGNKQMKTLLHFPMKAVKLSAALCRMSKKLYYTLLSKRK